MCENNPVTYLQQWVVGRLDELWEEYSQYEPSEFLLGQIYACVECLQVILTNEGADHETLLALEARYGIR